MFNINNFLEKFKKLTPPDDDIKEEIIEIISSLFKKEIDKKQIAIKNSVIYIESDPVLKNEIFMKKQFILSKLIERFDKKAPKNIL